MSEVTSNDRRPNWDMWRLMPEARLWELVALSMNVDPEKVQYDRGTWFADNDASPFDEDEKFRIRAKIVDRNTNSFQVTVASMCPFDSRYTVRSFVRWILAKQLTVPPELASLLRDDASPQAMTDKAVEEGTPFPHFITSARPETIPPELMALSDDARITYEHSIGGWRGGGERSAGAYRAEIAATIKRQAEGFFTLIEAAQILADTLPGFTPADTVQRFLDAHQAGELPIHRGDTRLLRRVGERVLVFYDLLNMTELDAWLRTTSGHRFPGADSDTEPLPAADRGRLLKREASIADNVRRWPIERDLKDAAENGLGKAARWKLKPMQRGDELRGALHAYLTTADKMAKPPTAREVLSAWQSTRPPGILKVTSDGVEYLANNGTAEGAADIQAIAERISRLIEAC